MVSFLREVHVFLLDQYEMKESDIVAIPNQ